MTFFWLWLLLVLLGVAAFVLVISYVYSKNILRPPNHRVPLGVFPDQFHLPYEKVVFNTRDGLALRGWFIPAEEADSTIIVMHGWGNNRGEALSATQFLHTAGYNLLAFDFRACGESAGSMSSVGYLEKADLAAAMTYLREVKTGCAEKVGLYGISMGAAVAINSAADYPEVRCVVSEATFTSYEKVVGRWAWNHMKIPYYPFLPLALMFVRMRLHADPEQFSPINNIASLSPRPLLMIHGSHDALAPLKYTRRMFEKAGEPKELWVVAGATHSKCSETGGLEYRSRITEFFRKNMA